MDENTEIVKRAVEGDTKAFETLVLTYQKKVYNIAFRMTGNQEDAFDLSQEAFIKAYKSLSGFKMESKFSTWIYSIISNLCIDFCRKRKRLSEVPLSYGEDNKDAEISDERFLPEKEFERAEMREIIEESLSSLSLEHRQIFTMRDIEGLSYQDISDALDIEVGTVKSRISRAREQLRKIIAGHGNLSSCGASKYQTDGKGVSGNG